MLSYRKQFRLAIGLLACIGSPWVALGQIAQPQSSVTSESDYYYKVFHHVALLKQMADTAQQQGKDRSNLRQLVRLRGGLTETEGQVLERISLQCERDVAAQNAKAKVIIDQFHAQFPSAQVNPSFPPKSPAVLDSMWEERNNIILTARNQLRSALGEAEFARFDKFIKTPSTALGPAPDFQAPPSDFSKR